MTSPPELDEARELLRRRLALTDRAVVPSPPASRHQQRFGLEAAVEQRFCSEALAHLLEGAAPSSVLVVDLSGTGRAATVWLGHALGIFAQREPPPELVTLALPATPPAGRGRLLRRFLLGAAAKVGLRAEVISGTVSASRSAPVGEGERGAIRGAYDLIIVLALSGSAGIDAPWPEHWGAGWLSLADGAVFGLIDPDSLVGDLPRLARVDPHPLRLRLETLEGERPRLVGQVTLDDQAQAKLELPRLIEASRRRPWRAIALPPSEEEGTCLGCPSERAARALVAPMTVRRSLVAGRLRLISAQDSGSELGPSPGQIS